MSGRFQCRGNRGQDSRRVYKMKSVYNLYQMTVLIHPASLYMHVSQGHHHRQRKMVAIRPGLGGDRGSDVCTSAWRLGAVCLHNYVEAVK